MRNIHNYREFSQLNEHSSINEELGLKPERLKEKMPKSYLAKIAKEKQKKEKWTKQTEELNSLKNKILSEFRNINWRDIGLNRTASFRRNSDSEFTFKFPKKLNQLFHEFRLKLANLPFPYGDNERLRQFFGDCERIFSDYASITTEHDYNRTHFSSGLPDFFKGMNLGFKLYRRVIEQTGFIVSNDTAKPGVVNIYYQLMREKDLNCVVTKYEVLIIKKSLGKDEKTYALSTFLQFISSERRFILGKNIIFDSALQKELGLSNIKYMISRKNR
jgi:hypothetical protein